MIIARKSLLIFRFFRMLDGESKSFEVKVGLHQGSVLSIFLFIIVMVTVSREVRGGLTWELLYADNLVLIGEKRRI